MPDGRASRPGRQAGRGPRRRILLAMRPSPSRLDLVRLAGSCSGARLLLAGVLALALGGCDAGHRENPGVDNTLGAPAVRVSTPHEGQVVVPSRPGGPVLAKIDVMHRIGRNEGARVRYRLDKGAVQGAWAELADPAVAVSLGVLAPTGPEESYLLVVEVLDKAGTPFTQDEKVGEGEQARTRTRNPDSTVRRSFRVATAWK